MSDVEITADDGASVAPVVSEVEATSDAQASTTEQVETQEEGQPRNDKGQFQGRINEITKARREAERGWQSEKQLRESLEQQLAQYKSQPSQSQSDKPPSLADYSYDTDAYSAALTEYVVSRASSSAEAKLREQATQQTQQQTVQKFEERSREYAATHPGYDQSLEELGRVVRFAPEVIEAIAVSEYGPAVAHHLATHLDEADRISRLPAHLAAVQLGRIEAQVSTPRLKPVTNAPTPVPTLGGGSAAKKNLASLSYADYKREREKAAR